MFKSTTPQEFAAMAEEFDSVINTAIDPRQFPPGRHTDEEKQFIQQEVTRLLSDKH